MRPPHVPYLPDTIYLSRHGESLGNALGMHDTSLRDVPNHRFPLTERGIAQARSLGRYLAASRILDECGAIHTSTFLRPQQTLAAILEMCPSSLLVFEDPRLDEWWKGIFYSMDGEERNRLYPDEQRVVDLEGWYQHRPPQGESGKDVEVRILGFLQGLRDTPFIVGHGRVAGFMDRLLCGREIRSDCKYPNPKNCELWRFRRGSDGLYVRESLFVPP